MNPDVHDTGIALGLTHGIGNAAATLGVLDPEVADALVGVREGEIATLGVGERGGIEVELHVVGLGPVDPALEVRHFYLVAIDELAAEVAIDLMEIEAVVTGDEGLDELDVLTYLVDVAGTAGIVTCGLDTSGEGLVALETDYIVGLPAVEGDLLLLEGVENGVGIDTNGGVAVFGDLIRFFNKGCFHII